MITTKENVLLMSFNNSLGKYVSHNKKFRYDYGNYYSDNEKIGFLEGGLFNVYNKTKGTEWFINNSVAKHTNYLINMLIKYHKKYKIINFYDSILKNKNIKKVEFKEKFDCPILLEYYGEGIITICNHIFSFKGFMKWFSNNRTCPLCRKIL